MVERLTATPCPDIETDGRRLVSRGFGDIYFSTDGGLAESEAVFLAGCGLPEAWTDRQRFTIGELGFGTGLNFLATWRAWQNSEATGRLHVVSIEGFPLDRNALTAALAHFPELGRLGAKLITMWPGRVAGVHRLHLDDRVTLDLWHRPVADALADMRMRADAWFLDGFSPSQNPDMWRADILHRVTELSAPGARLATFTVAGEVRRGLADAGWQVERVEGFGRKRHRLQARLPGKATETIPTIRPIIIGAGIAGASLARSFGRRGIAPIVIARPDHDARAASANPMGLIKPRLDLQSRPESRFFLSSYLYARHAYAAPLATGISQIAKSETEAARFAKLADQAALPPHHMEGTETGLAFAQGLVIDPRTECAAMAKEIKRAEIRAIRQDGKDWIVGDADGEVARGTHIFIAAGVGVRDLTDLQMRYSRGQLSVATGRTNPVAYGGYAAMAGRDLILGATHDRLDDADPHVLRDIDDVKNKAAYTAHTGRDPGQVRGLRASVRVTSKDTLPRLGETAPGCWVLTGLGSRGLVFAPLLAEDVVSAVLSEPRALETATSERFAP